MLKPSDYIRKTLNPFDRLGDILVNLGYIDRKILEKFVYQKQDEIQKSNKLRSSIEELVSEDRGQFLASYHSHYLGEVLVEAKLITNKQLKEALHLQEDIKFPNIPKNKIVLLSEILHKISRSRNLYSVLNLVMNYCNKVVDAEASTLFLHNKEKNALIFNVTTGDKKNMVIEKAMPVNEGIAGWVFQNDKSAIVNNAASDKRVCKSFDKQTGFKARNVLCVPVRVNYKPEGALEVLNKIGNKSFSKKDECLLNILSNQIGVHMENRILVEELDYRVKQVEKEKNKYQKLYSEKENLLNQLSQAYEQLKSHQKELLEASRFKGIGILAAGAAHDFNNTLTAILGQVETFTLKELKKSNQLSENGVEVLRNTFKGIVELCIQAKHLTSSLLRLGKREVIKKEPVNIESFLLEVIKPLERQFSTRGIHLRKVFLSDIPTIILDKGNINDLITNIVVNALNAIEERQLRLRELHQNPEMNFTIEVNQKDNSLILEFIDTGIGISPVNIEKVFDPFFSTKKQTMEKGTGLGLTMVRRIVGLHNGHINIQSVTQEMIDSDPETYSKKQCGTTITIQIPMIKATQEQLESQEDTKSFAQSKETLIYIAEDEKYIKDFLCTVIPELGFYQVEGFDNGQLLLEAIKVKIPDLIITDIQMPKMDGLTLCREIDRICHANKPTIIISTGKSEKDNLEPFFSLGIQEVLEKPYQIKELMNKINQALFKNTQ